MTNQKVGHFHTLACLNKQFPSPTGAYPSRVRERGGLANSSQG